MAKTAKQLEIDERHIYKPEIKTCPHCSEPFVLAGIISGVRRYSSWMEQCT